MRVYHCTKKIAKELGVAQGKVVAWVKSGELRGVNVATKPGSRPRFRIAEEDLAKFLKARTACDVRPPEPVRRRRRRTETEAYL